MKWNIPLHVFMVSLALTCFSSAGNTYSYTFTNSVDGTNWPALLEDGDSASDGFDVLNESNNAVMFTDNYVAAGNASRIEGEALWGNPRIDSGMNDPYLDLGFESFFSEDEIDGEEVLVDQVTSVSFDFAWATSAGNPVQPPPLEAVDIDVEDYEGNAISVSVDLNETFTHSLGGTGEGRQGRVVLAASDLGLDNIAWITIDFDPLFGGQLGAQTEFAIDNLTVDVNDGETPPPTPSNVYPVFQGSDDGMVGFYINALKRSGVFSSRNDVRNDGGTAATFTVTLQTSDPAIHQPTPVVEMPIDPMGRVSDSVAWDADMDSMLSGTYTGSFLVVNNTNSEDPDNTVDFTFELFDPPELTDNSSILIEWPGTTEVTVSNAPAGPHAGALRASVKVTELSMSNPAFSLSGITVDDQLDPGNTMSGTISFDPGSLPPGTYTGELRMQLKMVDKEHGFLNGDQPVPDIVWNLQATVESSGEDTVSVAPGDNIGDSGLGISDPQGGVTVLDGVSGEAQDITLAFNDSPPDDGTTPIATPFDLTFTGTPPVYVLAVSYQDGAVPAGRSEMDLRIEVYDAGTGSWVPAISLNSDDTPPDGAAPYEGSFDAYLAALGGGTLDAADLSAFGVDAANNQAWVVVDHASTFRLVTAKSTSTEPPVILGIAYDPATNTATITYQSVSGEVFGVKGSPDLDNFADLPDTAPGDGSVKQYTHTPPVGAKRYFYQMSRRVP